MYLTLRTRSLLSICAVSLLGIGLTGAATWRAWEARGRALELEAASVVLSTLSTAAINLSLERSVTQVALSLNVPVEQKLRVLIDNQRRISTAGFDETVRGARKLHTSDRIEDFESKLTGYQKSLDGIRAEADAFMAVSLDRRDATRANAIPILIKDTVSELQATRLLLRGPGFNLPTSVTLLEQIQEKAWQLREFGGRERTYLAIAVARKEVISASHLTEMKTLHARAEEAWNELGHLISHRDTPADVVATVKAIGPVYFGTYGRIRKSIIEMAMAGRADYPIGFDAFFEESSRSLATVESAHEKLKHSIDEFWKARADADVRQLLTNTFFLLTFLGGAIAAILTISGAFRRFADIRAAMATLAAGDLNTVIPHTAATDEVGQMAGAVQVFKTGLAENANLTSTQAADAAKKLERARRAQELTSDFEASAAGLCEKLARAAAEFERTAGQMRETATLTSSRSAEVVSAANQASSNVQTVATAAEEMSASIRALGSQATYSSSAAALASRTVTTAKDKVSELAGMAARIGSVVELITNIANQTNLLALNATIEAARAGDAGRGFAVVASEVKQLANQTAKATDEIGGQISLMQNSTQDVVGVIQQIATTVAELAAISAQVTSSMEDQNIATSEIAQNVQQAARGTEQVSIAMEDVKAGASGTGSAAEQVLTAARDLSRSTDELRRKVDSYIRDVNEAA